MESNQPSLWTGKDLQPVKPIEPVAPWVGGKSRLAAQLVAMIAEVPHRTYAEPFVGMGGVFFRRTFRPQAEVINDLNRDVANLFRILSRHYVPFTEMLRWQITTRDGFEKLQRTDPDTLTDLERAARFLYLQRTAFGGKVEGRTFGVSPGECGAFDVSRVQPLLEDMHDRLKGVVVECLPYADLLQRYDRPETLFYLDPPYDGSEHYYGKKLFTPIDHSRLAEQLAGMAGKFILSINDTPDMREVFGRFSIQEVTVLHSLNGSEPRETGELIVRN